jgi:DNA-directed RNA polymerase specialized sigma24 family protein
MIPNPKQAFDPDDPALRLTASVYRYHLGLCGDPGEAHCLAEATLKQAACAGQPAGIDRAAWLLGIARYVRAYPPREVRKSAATLPNEREDKLPALYAAARTAEMLCGLPSDMADAVALVCFGETSPENLAAVLAKPIPDAARDAEEGLTRLVDQNSARLDPENVAKEAADLREELATLAEQLPIPPDLVENCRALFRVDVPGGQVRPRAAWPGWPRRLRLRRALDRLSRVSLAALCVALFGVGLWALRPQTHSIAQPSPAAPVTFKTNAERIGRLTPPPESTCQAWKERFSVLFGNPVEETPSIFSDPTLPSTDPSASGNGCLISITGSEQDFPDTAAALQRAADLLRGQKFTFRESFECSTCRAGNHMFGSYWNGQGTAWSNGLVHAVLSMAWTPDDPQACPSGQACQVPLEKRRYALRLWLASDDANASITLFLKAWVNNQPDTLIWLSSAQRETAPNLAALDKLAGFKRGPGDVLQLTWELTENNGHYQRLNLKGVLINNLMLPEREVAPFKIDLQESPSGRWEIAQIGDHLPLPVIQDTVFWAVADGSVYRRSLVDGSTEMLAGPGSYNPALTSGNQLVEIAPQMSPDGHWLTLTQPVTALRSQGTVLIDLNPPGFLKKLDKSYLTAWSPDSKRLALFALDNPRQIEIWEAPFDLPPQALTTFSEDLVSLAWSPDGMRLAALTRIGSVTIPDTQNMAIDEYRMTLIEAGRGGIQPLTTLRGFAGMPYTRSLAWTAAGDEIWVRALQIGVSVADGSINQLFSSAWGTVRADQVFRLLYEPANGYNQNTVLSPDGRWLAENQTLNRQNSTSGSLSVQPAAEVGPNLWVEEQSSINQIAWTADSGYLVSGAGAAQPGTIQIWSANNGFHVTLAREVYSIGVGSDLLRRGYMLAPQGKYSPLPNPKEFSGWSKKCFDMVPNKYCMSVPPSWETASLGGTGSNGIFLLYNFSADPPLSWVMMKNSDILIQLVVDRDIGGQFSNGVGDRFPANQEDKTWETFDWNGTTVYHRIQVISLLDTHSYYTVKVGDRLIDVEFTSANPESYWILQKIVSSLTVEQGSW